MGGFRVNGCGVTDHFKRVKSLGMHLCPSCGRAAEFFLEEAKQKVDVLFIPTVTLKSRYAVMCSKCDQGQFCSDQWAVHLMNSPTPPPVIFESQVQQETPPVPAVEPERQETVTPPPPPPPPPEPPAPPAPKPGGGTMRSSIGIPVFFKCAHCGVTQMREGDFCAYCGKPAPEDPNAQKTPEPERREEPPAQAVCPACGSPQLPGSKFCAECGQPLAPSEPAQPVCPACGAKILDGAFFCMECGARL